MQNTIRPHETKVIRYTNPAIEILEDAVKNCLPTEKESLEMAIRVLKDWSRGTGQWL